MEMKKKKEQNQSIYVTLMVILVALAVAVAVTSVVGKRTAEPKVGEVLQTEDLGEDGADEVFDSEAQSEDDQPVFESEKEDSQTDEKADEAVTTEAAKSEDSDAALVDAEPEADALPQFISPVSGYVLNSHSDTVPVFSVTMNDYRTHVGVDVYAELGEAVHAAADGVIGAIWEDPMMGTCMTVVHSGGAVSTYKGLYATIPDGIVEGASVTKGQAIAAVGETALAEVAEQSHVHYELSIDGVPVDPCLYMEFNEEFYEN